MTSDQKPDQSVFTKPRRRIVFSSILILLAWGLIESASYLAYLAIEGEPLSPSALAETRAKILTTGLDPRDQMLRAGQVIHPYLGSVYNFDERIWVDGAERFPITRHGFSDKAEPFFSRSSNRVIVAIVGGSVAGIFAAEGTATLETILKRDPRYAKKEFVL